MSGPAIRIERREGVYHLASEIQVPRGLEETFAFFADAANLEKLTPAWLNFQILTPTPLELRAGSMIDYRLRVHGIPVRWRSEITTWEPPHRFVDKQVRGPYRRWIHTHTFEARDGGTLVRDDVEYAVPGGALAHMLFVRRDIERIFGYRHEVLARLFGEGARD